MTTRTGAQAVVLAAGAVAAVVVAVADRIHRYGKAREAQGWARGLREAAADTEWLDSTRAAALAELQQMAALGHRQR